IIESQLCAQAADYDVTIKTASAQHAALIASLSQVEFSKEEIKTTNFSVDTEYDNVSDERGNYKRIFKGYRCEHASRIEFALSLQRLSLTIAALSVCRAKPQFSIMFTVKEPDNLKELALVQAADTARHRAEVLCVASGVSLGALLSINCEFKDLTILSPTMFTMRNVAAANTEVPELNPQDVSVSDSASFTFEIA
ncbi:MAG: SIMPL domain-containing protein, partial [Oscillospiraceae bacterium]